MGSIVISLSWLEIVSMGEGGHLTSSKVEDLLRESIPNSIWLLPVNEFKHVILDNWALRLDSGLSSGQVSSNAVTKGEDVLILLVLKSVLVDIDHAGGVSDASIDQPLVRLGCWVNGGTGVSLLNSLSSVHIAEGHGFVSASILLD